MSGVAFDTEGTAFYEDEAGQYFQLEVNPESGGWEFTDGVGDVYTVDDTAVDAALAGNYGQTDFTQDQLAGLE